MRQSSAELQFSSSVAKLLNLRDRMQHPLWPVTLQLVPTNRCNLNCDFCSVKYRGDDELDIEIIMKVLGDLSSLGLKGVEITGGGDPTLYPHLNEVIGLCREWGLDVGLITNGILLMPRVKMVDRLTWVRVSLNSLDYVDGVELEGFPANVTLGFSYVLNDKTTQKILDKVKQYADDHDVEYVRIVPDCLDLEKEYHFDFYHPRFYLQAKALGDLEPVAPCRMGYLKPYLNSDGYFYWCSGVCLDDRFFPKEYRMGSWQDIAKTWCSQETFDCDFHKCFWVEHNRLLELANTDIIHRSFL